MDDFQFTGGKNLPPLGKGGKTDKINKFVSHYSRRSFKSKTFQEKKTQPSHLFDSLLDDLDPDHINFQVSFSCIETTALYELSDLSYKVYGHLENLSYKIGYCDRPLTYIAKLANKSVSSIKRALKELEEKNFIFRVRYSLFQKGSRVEIYPARHAKKALGRLLMEQGIRKPYVAKMIEKFFPGVEDPLEKARELIGAVKLKKNSTSTIEQKGQEKFSKISKRSKEKNHQNHREIQKNTNQGSKPEPVDLPTKRIGINIVDYSESRPKEVDESCESQNKVPKKPSISEHNKSKSIYTREKQKKLRKTFKMTMKTTPEELENEIRQTINRKFSEEDIRKMVTYGMDHKAHICQHARRPIGYIENGVKRNWDRHWDQKHNERLSRHGSDPGLSSSAPTLDLNQYRMMHRTANQLIYDCLKHPKINISKSGDLVCFSLFAGQRKKQVKIHVGDPQFFSKFDRLKAKAYKHAGVIS
jgi:DNA-binding MarR family transcriptional regulator